MAKQSLGMAGGMHELAGKCIRDDMSGRTVEKKRTHDLREANG